MAWRSIDSIGGSRRNRSINGNLVPGAVASNKCGRRKSSGRRYRKSASSK